MIKIRLDIVFPEIVRIHKAKIRQLRITSELIDAVAVCRILQKRFLPLVFRDDRKLLLHSLPVRTIDSEDAVVIQNLSLLKTIASVLSP